VELALPLLKHIDTLINGSDGLVWLLPEDALDVDLSAYFVADFVRDALEQVFHLALILVNMA
jgi:hypothetical protein